MSKGKGKGKGKRYTDELKVEAVKQVTEHGYCVQEVAERLGISTKSLYDWKTQLTKKRVPNKSSDEQLRIAQLEAELKRVKEERDILKKSRKVLCKPVRVKYAFIREHQQQFTTSAMCRVLKLNRSGFYAWLKKPLSNRTIEDSRLLRRMNKLKRWQGLCHCSKRIRASI